MKRAALILLLRFLSMFPWAKRSRRRLGQLRRVRRPLEDDVLAEQTRNYNADIAASIARRE